MKPVYIYSQTLWDEQWDLKSLIADANVRRRMSRLVKMGVATGLKCWNNAGLTNENTAIITATQYGCLTDSEKFLRQMITCSETNLSPTPFIQSTFNTIGAQIALMKECRGYNMTYVNRSHSLYDALVDAAMLAIEGREVLLGYIDEETPVLRGVAGRMRSVSIYDGAVFMVVTSVKPSCPHVEIETLDILNRMTNTELIDKLVG